MSRKPDPKPDDPEQSKRFVETARKVETDEDPKIFEETFQRLISARTTRKPRHSAGR